MDLGGAEGQPAAAAAAAPPPVAQRPAWEAVLHLLLPRLAAQHDRHAVRLVSREWRAVADHAWQAAALNCSPWRPGQQPPPPELRSGGFLLPRLRSLSLVEFSDHKQLQILDQLFELAGSGAVPRHCSLELCTVYGIELAAPGLPRLLLPQLQRLSVEGIHLKHLETLRNLTALTELSIGALHTTSSHTAGVSVLAALPRLQALRLPQLEEGEREALAALTGLARLAFGAAGKGAVGPSLLPLAPRLRELSVSLFHRHEHFIVAHPRVDWASLRALTALRRLEISHLAAYTFFAAPEVTWTDEAPVAHEADQLIAALPEVRFLELRLSFCRLSQDHATPEGEPHELLLPAPDGRPRRFHRSIELVPAREPGARRCDGWWQAWWQDAVRGQLSEAAAGGVAQAAEALQRRVTEAGEVAGWTAIRPGAPRTFDTRVCYSLVQQHDAP